MGTSFDLFAVEVEGKIDKNPVKSETVLVVICIFVIFTDFEIFSP